MNSESHWRIKSLYEASFKMQEIDRFPEKNKVNLLKFVLIILSFEKIYIEVEDMMVVIEMIAEEKPNQARPDRVLVERVFSEFYR